MTRPSLLLVDDEPEILELLALTFPDCETVTAHNARDAIEALRARRFDVLISDMKMPGGSGLSLVEQARRLWPDLVVVIITGHHEKISERERAMVHRWVLKPFRIREIREIVMEALLA